MSQQQPPYPAALMPIAPIPFPKPGIQLNFPAQAVVTVPSNNALVFRFAPGTQATQIQTSSWAARKVVLYTPGPGSDSPNIASIYMALQGGAIVLGGHTAEIPPGSALTIEISDITLLWFVAHNSTDVISGWAESYP